MIVVRVRTILKTMLYAYGLVDKRHVTISVVKQSLISIDEIVD
jgi:hypothetical protein